MPVTVEPGIRQLLLRLPLLRGLEETELLALLAQAEISSFKDGDYVLQEGEPGTHVYVLLGGQAVVTRSSTGIRKILKELGPGECIGEMALLESGPRSASVRALGSCKLLRIDGRDLDQMAAVSAKIYRNLAIMLSRRLREANER
jgi:CRP/FNR family transcriptional regulator, cyclic AMP receptor protein